MLLSLRIANFKSIRRASIRFGALTCILGHNGVGKSNLFDAIHFLSVLAEREISSASSDVRRTSEGSHSPLDLVYGRDPRREIRLAADMIVPKEVIDDFGQTAEPSTTLLTYSLFLGYDPPSDRLVVNAETLTHAKLGDYRAFTAFPSSIAFRNSVLAGSRRGGPLISTDAKRGAIVLHGDGGSRGRGAPVGRSPLTVLGGTHTADYPTVLAAKREMSSWRLLHLEPSSMRSPDSRGADPHVTASGGNLAATLNSLIQHSPRAKAEIVRRLRQLNSEVADLDVYTDLARDQFSLRAQVPGVDQWLYGRALSDGTLRYIAMSLMLADAQDRGALCLEEPENGIHPSRIPSLVQLLRDYAVDLEEPVGDDNPLRQVLINTHSPDVARQMTSEDVLFAERGVTSGGDSFSVFRPLADTWRAYAFRKEQGELPPKDRQSLADFIGGSPIVEPEVQQLEFNFGSAT